jgi:hypothetical protein
MQTSSSLIISLKVLITTRTFSELLLSYFSAPQQLSKRTKEVIGHAHVVIQAIPDLKSTSPLDPREFVFFKGTSAQRIVCYRMIPNADGIYCLFNTPRYDHFLGIDNPVSEDGTSTVEVPGGLPVGAYRYVALNSAQGFLVVSLK